MKVFDSEKQVLDFLKSKDQHLDDHDAYKLAEWFQNDFQVLLISDSEKHDYFKNYILELGFLCNFSTSLIVSNLKPEFVTLPEEVIGILQKKHDNESLKALVNLEDLVTVALYYDGLAHFINNYDGSSIDLFIENDIYFLVAY